MSSFSFQKLACYTCPHMIIHFTGCDCWFKRRNLFVHVIIIRRTTTTFSYTFSFDFCIFTFVRSFCTFLFRLSTIMCFLRRKLMLVILNLSTKNPWGCNLNPWLIFKLICWDDKFPCHKSDTIVKIRQDHIDFNIFSIFLSP